MFQAARVGAMDAAKDLARSIMSRSSIDWRTPNEEDAQKQAEAIEQLVLAGASGIAVSCSDANKLTDAINSAVKNGVPVATFDSDAPASQRFVTYGVDDVKCGEQVMNELAKVMGGKGDGGDSRGKSKCAESSEARARSEERREEIPGHQNSRHLLSQGNAAGRRRARRTGDAIESRHHRLGDDWRVAVVHGQRAEVAAGIGEMRLGGRAAAAAGVFAQRSRAAVAGAAGLRMGLSLRRTPHQQSSSEEEPAEVHDVSPLVPVTKENVDEFAKNWEKWLPKVTWRLSRIAGASFDAPENTLSAVALAWKQGADAVEIDVHCSRDGKVVVIHDPTLRKLARCPGSVCDKTFAELQRLDVGLWKHERWLGERIPSIEAVLGTIPKRKRLFIEVKCGVEGLPELVVALSRSGTAVKSVVLLGFRSRR